MFYKLIEKLNRSKKHPYYYISPLVYAIGDACEQINITSMKIKNKRIVILFPRIFKFFFKYKLCNESLFENFSISSLKIHNRIFIKIINFFLNLEFFFRRIKFLFLSKIIKLNKTEYDSFPYVGIHSLYNKYFVKKTLMKLNLQIFQK